METQVLVFSGGLFNDVVVAHCACAWLYIGWCILENVYKSLQSQKGSHLSEIIPRPVTIHWNIKPGYMCHFHHKLSNNIWSNFNVVVVFFLAFIVCCWMNDNTLHVEHAIKTDPKNSYSIEIGHTMRKSEGWCKYCGLKCGTAIVTKIQ